MHQSDTGEAPVVAAGRSISGSNADRLLAAHASLLQGESILAEVLKASGYLSNTSYPAPPFTKQTGVKAAALPIA